MRIRARVPAILGSIALLILICGFALGPAQIPAGPAIVTAAPVYEPLAELRGRERFPQGAQLLVVRDGKAVPLVEGFAATADADVSFDGKSVLFAGKQASGDLWQIWELTLENRSVRKVITTATDAERPFYLPGGRMVWAQRAPWGFQLESAEDGHAPAHTPQNPTAGPGVLPLTYTQTSAFPADVLADGGVLLVGRGPLVPVLERNKEEPAVTVGDAAQQIEADHRDAAFHAGRAQHQLLDLGGGGVGSLERGRVRQWPTAPRYLPCPDGYRRFTDGGHLDREPHALLGIR